MQNPVGRLTAAAIALYVCSVLVAGCNKGPQWDKSNPQANNRTGVPTDIGNEAPPAK